MFFVTDTSNTSELGALFDEVTPLPTTSLDVVEEFVGDAELLLRAGSRTYAEALTSMLDDVYEALGKAVGVGLGASQEVFLRRSFVTEMVTLDSAGVSESVAPLRVCRPACQPAAPQQKAWSLQFPFSLTVSPFFDWSFL